MFHSAVKFRGPAAMPGVYMLLTRVNQGKDLFFSHSQTGHRMAGYSFSPLNSISYQLSTDHHSYPIKTGILSRGWQVEKCAFRMWTIGRIDQHPSCVGLSFDECCTIALILAAMIRKHLDGQGYETVGYENGIPTSPDHPLARIALILFEEFLRLIASTLLEDMDLNSHNFDMDKSGDL